MIYDVNRAIHHNEKNLIQITENLINSSTYVVSNFFLREILAENKNI